MSSAFTKKLRSAIKAKIQEFGVEADDELPDYVMVLAANRKSKQQIKTDLQLFLGKHTDIFVSWLFDAFDRIQKSESDSTTRKSKSPEKEKPPKKEEKPSKKEEKQPKKDEEQRSPSVELVSTSATTTSRLRSQVVVPENSTINSSRHNESTRVDRARIRHSESDRNRSERTRDYDRTRRRSRTPERHRDSSSKRYNDHRRNERSTKISDDEMDEKKASTQQPSNKRAYSPKIHYDDERQAGPSRKSDEKDSVDEGQNEEEILTVNNERPKETKFIIRVGNRQICRTVPTDSPSPVTNASPEVNEDAAQRRKRHADDPGRAVKNLLKTQNVKVVKNAEHFGKENVKRARIEERSSKSPENELVEPYSPVPLQSNADDEKEIDSVLNSLKPVVQAQVQPMPFYQPPANQNIEMRPERCKFWPDCEKGDECAYHHPTRLCTRFPNCHFGAYCLNIHPMCKFNLKCAKLGCPFTHNHRKTGFAASQQHDASVRASAKSHQSSESLSDVNSEVGTIQSHAGQAPCKYWNRCTDEACLDVHPKKCRYGLGCQDRQCKFLHRKPDLSRFKWTAS